MKTTKTKIVATLGPASSSPEIIASMIDNGVDVFRLNFSHGTLEDHEKMLNTIRAACADDCVIAVMGDLCGPKIRTGIIEPDGQVLQAGADVAIIPQLETGTAECFGTNYENFAHDVKLNDRVFIDDGMIALHVIDIEPDRVICRVDTPGILKSRKGINLPDSELNTPSITERDWQCADWAIANGIDYLALSFVRRAADVQQLKEHIAAAGSNIKVVSKIETPAAMKDLDNIVRASDAVLVARGDLGVEMDLEQVPVLQKRITLMCRQKAKPVIVATQMLQSMIESPTATRAEVSDVANAIIDYADAVMLSGETAVGQYPVEAVKTMGKIARVTERYLDQAEHIQPPKVEATGGLAVRAAVVRGVGQIVEDIDAKVVAVWTRSGASAQVLSKSRIDVPIIAISSDRKASRQMCLHYGVISRHRQQPNDIPHFAAMVDEIVIGGQLAGSGDSIVLVAGAPFSGSATTDAVLVHVVQ